jgi:hypothetical protein
LYDEELKVVLKCMGTTKSICCEDHLNISHISAATGFWTFVGEKFLLVCMGVKLGRDRMG